MPDIHIWNQSVNNGPGSSWGNAYHSIQDLDDAITSAPGTLTPRDTVLIASDHVEDNKESTEQGQQWWVRLAHGGPMPIPVISVNRATLSPEAMVAHGGVIKYDHTTNFDALANWCGVNVEIDSSKATPDPPRVPQLRITGNWFFSRLKHDRYPIYFGSPYASDTVAQLTDCQIVSTANEKTLFGTSGTDETVTGLIAILTRCEFNVASTRTDGVFWLLGKQCTVILKDCTHVGQTIVKRVRAYYDDATMRLDNSAVPGFVFPNDWIEDFPGNNHIDVY